MTTLTAITFGAIFSLLASLNAENYESEHNEAND